MPNSIYDDWGLDFGSLEVQDLISRYADNDDSISIRQGNYGTMHHQELIPYDTRVIIDEHNFKPKDQYYLSIDDDREMKNQIEMLKRIISETGWDVYFYSDIVYYTHSKSLELNAGFGEGLYNYLSISTRNNIFIDDIHELINLYKYYKIIRNIYTYFSEYHPNWNLALHKMYRNMIVITTDDTKERIGLLFEAWKSDNYSEMTMRVYHTKKGFRDPYLAPTKYSALFKSNGGNLEINLDSDFIKYFDNLILEVLNNGKIDP